MIQPSSTVHLLSGGLDSVTMLYDMVSDGFAVHCLLVDYKQPHVQELQLAKTHCSRLGVLYTAVDIPDLGRDHAWVVPNRNAIFISLAVSLAVRANASIVTIGCNLDDARMFQDCTPGFIAAMNGCVKASGYQIEVRAPYIDYPKWKIGDLARQLGVKTHEIWSCYRGGQEPCGTCPACLKLKEAVK